jgi:hypothetical protein
MQGQSGEIAGRGVDVRIALVVAQQDVVARLEFLISVLSRISASTSVWVTVTSMAWIRETRLRILTEAWFSRK